MKGFENVFRVRNMMMILVVLAVSCLLWNEINCAEEDGFDEVRARRGDMDEDEMEALRKEVGGINPMDSMDPYAGDGYDDPYGGMGGGYGDPYGGGGGRRKAPQPAELETDEEIEEFLKSSDTIPIVLGYFDAANHESDIETFTKLTETMGTEFKFGYSTDKDVLEHNKIKGTAVYVYKPSKFVNSKYDKPRARYPSKTLSLTSLEHFIADKWFPSVGVKDESNKDIYGGHKQPELTLFTKLGDLEKSAHMKEFNYFANRLRKIMTEPEFAGKFIVNIADRDTFKSDMKTNYGIKKVQGHADVAVGMRVGDTYYKLSDEGQKFSVDDVTKFLRDYQAGQLEGKVRSASSSGGEDEEIDDSHVVKVTNDNAAEVLGSTTADIMMEFYAPWCGHCKHLKPEYAELASSFADDDSVVIAAMDATANDIPSGYNVEGYPTVYFVPAKTKKPVTYEGERTAAAMEEYIRAHKTAK